MERRVCAAPFLSEMIESTLCYLERGGCFLMLHRVKKKQDVNAGKWIGVGGKLEPGETPETCLRREVFEETGLTLTAWRFRGEICFRSDVCQEEVMYLYHATGFTGDLIDCNEGELRWIPVAELDALSMWEGGRVFLPLVASSEPPFRMMLDYRGEKLVGVTKEPLEESAAF